MAEIATILPQPESMGGYWLRALDLLKALPNFGGAVEGIRARLGIRPTDQLRVIKGLVADPQLLSWGMACDTPSGFNPEPYYYRTALTKSLTPLASRRKLKTLTESKVRRAQEIIHQYEQSRFPTLDREVARLRLFDIGKVPVSWHNTVKHYVLYGEQDGYPAKPRKGALSPPWAIKVDPQTLEPYAEIRIYAETNPGTATRFLWLARKLQKALPSYPSIINQRQVALMQAWIYFTLTKLQGLTRKKANEQLKRYGLNIVDTGHELRVLRRFKRLAKGWIKQPLKTTSKVVVRRR